MKPISLYIITRIRNQEASAVAEL
uniref:Uncharacterized protein n=1 Tax=Arundo donax TaxID=35708 RepID=A0A0A9A0Q1_ARUDO